MTRLKLLLPTMVACASPSRTLTTMMEIMAVPPMLFMALLLLSILVGCSLLIMMPLLKTSLQVILCDALDTALSGLLDAAANVGVL